VTFYHLAVVVVVVVLVHLGAKEQDCHARKPLMADCTAEASSNADIYDPLQHNSSILLSYVRGNTTRHLTS